MELMEEVAQDLRAKLKAELDASAQRRGLSLPVDWPDEVLRIVQYVLDQERFEVARQMMPGVASPLAIVRLVKA
jgi:hypothetical protein